MMKDFVIFTLYFSGIYFLCINIFYGLLMLFSWLKIKSYNQQERHLNLDRYRTGVSFIVPAFNEESLIVETIQTYLSLDYPRKEIIIINDGSKDQTFRLLQIMFQLRRTGADSTQFSSITYPELKVIQAEHRGKAHALNTGIMHASNEIICTMDADTIPTKEGVEAALKAFEWDPGLMAVGGIIQVLNTHVLKDNSPLKHMPQSWPTKFQTIEYIRTFLCVRLGWSFIRSTSLISGAFCMLKKKAWVKVGGFKADSITEDLDIIIRMRKFFRGQEHRFKVLPVTTCHTQVPSDLKHLMVQRIRWQMGLIQTLIQNMDMCLNRKYGPLGLVAIPYYWLAEIFSPLIEIFALSLLPMALINHWIDLKTVVLFAGAGLIYNLLLTLIGVFAHNQHSKFDFRWSYFKYGFYSLALNFGYKQLTSWWRLLALIKCFRKGYEWGAKPRQEITHQKF